MVWKEGIKRPQVLCDQCGHHIKDAKNGNALWLIKIQEYPEPEDIFFTHKQCTHAFELQRKGMWGTLDLDAFPIQLAANLGIRVKMT